MEEQRISLQNAKREGSQSFGSWYIKFIRKNKRDHSKSSDDDVLGNFESLPRFMQLATYQKWFREEHEIHISINVEVIGSDEWDFSYEMVYLPKEYENYKKRAVKLEQIYSFGGSGASYVGAWGMYEEALEEALQKALSLV